jgi:hypothetical protein
MKRGVRVFPFQYVEQYIVGKLGYIPQLLKRYFCNKSCTDANGYSFTFFFHLFSSPIFVYFAKKVNPRCLQLYLLFVCFCLCPLSTRLGIFIFSLDLVPIHFLTPNPHIASQPPCPSPPTPLPPEAAVSLAVPVDAATNYILPVLHSPL